MDIIPQPNFAIQKIGLSKLNEIFAYRESLYFYVYQPDYYLPPFKCPTITSDYLSGVCKGIFNCPKRSQILPGEAQCVKKISKVRLYKILIDLTKKKNQSYLGQGINKLPTKQYHQDIIQVIESRNSIFVLKAKKDRDNHQIDFPVELFKNVDMRIVPDGQGTIFKCTKEYILKDTLKAKGRQNQKKKQHKKFQLKKQEKQSRN